jgi:2-polyprenyl-3-methyl-5-hydroxy-6-metoxy-1,4-benzoquinol methylase/glycosyltransferase involved in cell wall biosynthesis
VTCSWAFLVDSVPFTQAVIAGETSLGGSESACLGLARALKARGHEVHIFATRLDADASGADATGVLWHPFEDFEPMNRFIEWDVCVSLRAFAAFAHRPVNARLRLLWSQDLLVPGAMQSGIMSVAWSLDHIVYVSEYHRRQWEQLQPELTSLGWVTRNGYDPAHVPADVVKHPYRVIHVSRPERGLGPLLAMWPTLKDRVPEAELQLCRYSSMYDQGPGSWSDVCAAWDAQVEAVNAQVGGITWLGELAKPALYQAIAEAAVMWYPGISAFAETSCIAAIEAQACGTPFVGSYRGALPETVPSGVLVRGVESKASYRDASIGAVEELLVACGRGSRPYRERQRAGLDHVRAYTYDVLAAEWEVQVTRWFEERYTAQKAGVLRQLLHEDDHVAAQLVASELGDTPIAEWCQYVMDGKDHSDEHYGNAAIQDPMREVQHSTRFAAVSPFFEHCASVLDVACGNGSFAIKLALDHQTIHVHGLDFAIANIDRARLAAAEAGVGDRCTFERLTVYDFTRHDLHADMRDYLERHGRAFDGLFVGEFLEHVVNYADVIDGLERACQPGATVVYTCPHGACAELVPRGVPLRRGHVHRYAHDDVQAIWGAKQGFRALFLDGGTTARGNPIGNWLIRYEMAAHRPCGVRPLHARIHKTRPMPTLTVGIIARDEETNIGRCLESVYRVADEIIVGDTGSTDATVAIAESYGAKVIPMDPVDAQPEGFAGARNAVLAQATGDWFLWIDCDEQLVGGPGLRRYLDGTTFNGYVIRQTHLYLDGPPTQDIPVRIFRHTGQVRFYGCIHEQPQDGDPNADVYPSLDAGDLRIAHTGYLTPGGRERKRVGRNRPLLIKDQHVFPDRTLGKVLCIREAVIEADNHRVAAGELTERARQGYTFAIQMFVSQFDDPGHKYHALARPWYEAALQHLGMGWEVEVSCAGRQGGLGTTRAKPERIWVRDHDEFQRVMVHRHTTEAAKMAPVRFATDPDELWPGRKREEVAV